MTGIEQVEKRTKIAVIGAGAMGQGIVQVSVQGGLQAYIFDREEGGAEAAKATIAKRLERLVEKERISQEACQQAISLMQPVSKLEGIADADFVVEAVFEDLQVKHEIFTKLENIVSESCILASNTSSIPIASIASVCRHPSRIAGLHFFNPVPLMQLVEVIVAAATSQKTTDALVALGKQMTRTPVVVKDSPGFLVNMGGRAFTTEGLAIDQDRVATPEQIDAIMRDCYGFRMGPFELMDLTGIDVNYPVSQIIYNGFMQDARLRTSYTHKAMVDAGRLGRKTGQGWFSYEYGKMVNPPSPDFIPQYQVRPVAVASDSPELISLCKELGLEIGDDDGACPLVAAPIGTDASETALQCGADARRLVCIDPVGNLEKRVVLMMAPGGDKSAAEKVAAGIIIGGRAVTLIRDSAGFVGQRLAAMVANLGCFMADIGLASPNDIDIAMRLGLNYPKGPLELADHLGADTVFTIMQEMHRISGDDRYRPSLWLRRHAQLNLTIWEE
jgi:3-hydroxybutyryl-CoA dehydrogenase